MILTQFDLDIMNYSQNIIVYSVSAISLSFKPSLTLSHIDRVSAICLAMLAVIEIAITPRLL